MKRAEKIGGDPDCFSDDDIRELSDEIEAILNGEKQDEPTEEEPLTEEQQQAQDAFDAEDYETAYFIWKRLAQENHIKAVGQLFCIYCYGKHADQDLEAAREYLEQMRTLDEEQAAEMADILNPYWAQRVISEFRVEDYPAAVEIYRDLSERGDCFGMVNMSVVYRNGFGIDVDLVKSREYLEKARENGLDDGIYREQNMWLSSAELEKQAIRSGNLSDSAVQLSEMAQQGSAAAAEALTRLYASAQFFDEQAARGWAQRAKENGSKRYDSLLQQIEEQRAQIPDSGDAAVQKEIDVTTQNKENVSLSELQECYEKLAQLPPAELRLDIVPYALHKQLLAQRVREAEEKLAKRVSGCLQ